MEFRSFGKILPIRDLNMVITQKIHGSNAALIVYEKDGELDLVCCSRNKFITPEDDNFGFARFVHDNKAAFLTLVVGRHDGEWAGPGINSGEGLKERTFVLFDYWRYFGVELPPQTVVVPVLYDGPVDMSEVDMAMTKLKGLGSVIVPGFMRPEGVVVSISGHRFKKVFEAEETGWKGASKPKRDPGEKRAPAQDISHLLQPIRLEKLLSKDESYARDYPASLGRIVSGYIGDLRDENHIEDYDAVKKELSRQVYLFIRATWRTT